MVAKQWGLIAVLAIGCACGALGGCSGGGSMPSGDGGSGDPICVALSTIPGVNPTSSVTTRYFPGTVWDDDLEVGVSCAGVPMVFNGPAGIVTGTGGISVHNSIANARDMCDVRVTVLPGTLAWQIPPSWRNPDGSDSSVYTEFEEHLVNQGMITEAFAGVITAVSWIGQGNADHVAMWFGEGDAEAQIARIPHGGVSDPSRAALTVKGTADNSSDPDDVLEALASVFLLTFDLQVCYTPCEPAPPCEDLRMYVAGQGVWNINGRYEPHAGGTATGGWRAVLDDPPPGSGDPGWRVFARSECAVTPSTMTLTEYGALNHHYPPTGNAMLAQFENDVQLAVYVLGAPGTAYEMTLEEVGALEVGAYSDPDYMGYSPLEAAHGGPTTTGAVVVQQGPGSAEIHYSETIEGVTTAPTITHEGAVYSLADWAGLYTQHDRCIAELAPAPLSAYANLCYSYTVSLRVRCPDQ